MVQWLRRAPWMPPVGALKFFYIYSQGNNVRESLSKNTTATEPNDHESPKHLPAGLDAPGLLDGCPRTVTTPPPFSSLYFFIFITPPLFVCEASTPPHFAGSISSSSSESRTRRRFLSTRAFSGRSAGFFA